MSHGMGASVPELPYAHFVFEALAYVVGIRLYLASRPDGQVPERARYSVLVGAAIGAAIGSKLMYLLEWPADTLAHARDLPWLMGGKSIVGGLLGGWVGVEIAKRKMGETRSTGDRFVAPLALGMMIGRVGCFLTGLADHTVGTPTTLPWGVDFGDGIPRHPTQLYEILGLLAILAGVSRLTLVSGGRFRLFMLAYFCLRFAIDRIKPDPHWVFGMTAIQVACLAGMLWAGSGLIRGFLGASASDSQ